MRVLDRIINDLDFEGAYFVVDALGECEDTSLVTFLNYLESYMGSSSSDKTKQPSKVKWLVTSRNETTIKEFLDRALQISLEDNSMHVDESVDRYVSKNVERLAMSKKYDSKLRTAVESHFRKNAKGTFLWVALACQEL